MVHVKRTGTIAQVERTGTVARLELTDRLQIRGARFTMQETRWKMLLSKSLLKYDFGWFGTKGSSWSELVLKGVRAMWKHMIGHNVITLLLVGL